MNIYRYVGNGVVNGRDAFGLQACEAIEESLLPEIEDLLAALAGLLTGLWNSMTNSSPSDSNGNVKDVPGKPGFKGEPGSTERGENQSRDYGEDGYPKTDRDNPHAPDHPEPGNGDHSHDWGRPEGGGAPTDADRGPAQDPKPGDSPKPRNPK